MAEESSIRFERENVRTWFWNVTTTLVQRKRDSTVHTLPKAGARVTPLGRCSGFPFRQVLGFPFLDFDEILILPVLYAHRPTTHERHILGNARSGRRYRRARGGRCRIEIEFETK